MESSPEVVWRSYHILLREARRRFEDSAIVETASRLRGDGLEEHRYWPAKRSRREMFLLPAADHRHAGSHGGNSAEPSRLGTTLSQWPVPSLGRADHEAKGNLPTGSLADWHRVAAIHNTA